MQFFSVLRPFVESVRDESEIAYATSVFLPSEGGVGEILQCWKLIRRHMGAFLMIFLKWLLALSIAIWVIHRGFAQAPAVEMLGIVLLGYHSALYVLHHFMIKQWMEEGYSIQEIIMAPSLLHAKQRYLDRLHRG